MSDHLLFDKLFDKLEAMDDKIDDIHTKVEVVDTKLGSVMTQVNHETKGLSAAHSRQDKIEGALKLGAWVLTGLGLTGAAKLLKESFFA